METWRTAAYLRLSREDGDKAESDSIASQHHQLEQYLAGHPELELAGYYTDDGHTGTNFDRPAFRRMEAPQPPRASPLRRSRWARFSPAPEFYAPANALRIR